METRTLELLGSDCVVLPHAVKPVLPMLRRSTAFRADLWPPKPLDQLLQSLASGPRNTKSQACTGASHLAQ